MIRSMGYLSDELRDKGFVPTGKDSPVADDGEVWMKGTEYVCSETGTVIDGNHHVNDNSIENDSVEVVGNDVFHKYPNSRRVRMVGGYFSSYDWGHDDDGTFEY